MNTVKRVGVVACLSALVLSLTAAPASARISVAYSDWPGWAAWEVGVQKGWFDEAGVDVEFVWFDYAPSMDAYAAGEVDAVCMTNGDALVAGAAGKPSRMILINDYSNGADAIVARPGIESVTDLRGRTVGVEVGSVSHLLLVKALHADGMSEDDVEVVDMPTPETPHALTTGAVDAVAARGPGVRQAQMLVAGATAVFTSADAPGLIYDTLAVSGESLDAHPDEWAKVVKVWYRIADYILDEANREDVLAVMSARVGVTPDEYAPLLSGAMFLSQAQARKRFAKGSGLDTLFGSTGVVDAFQVSSRFYDEPQDVGAYIDASFIRGPMRAPPATP